MKIKKLKPQEYNAVNIKYPDNKKLMDKVNELIDIVEKQQKEINELKFMKLDNPRMYD